MLGKAYIPGSYAINVREWINPSLRNYLRWSHPGGSFEAVIPASLVILWNDNVPIAYGNSDELFAQERNDQSGLALYCRHHNLQSDSFQNHYL